MNNERLATIYLDNQPVTLPDARPKVAAILVACGKPSSTSVQWLTKRSDVDGKSLRAEEVVDRTTDPTTAIYLTSKQHGKGALGSSVAPVPKAERAAGAAKGSGFGGDKDAKDDLAGKDDEKSDDRDASDDSDGKDGKAADFDADMGQAPDAPDKKDDEAEKDE